MVIGFLFKTIRHAREYTAEHLEVKNLNRRFEQMADVLNHDLLNPHERKAHIKAKKKEYKQRTKEQKKGKTARSRVFVLDFDGDIRASAGEHLREEISAVTGVADGDFLQRLHAVGGEARRDDVDIAPLHERYSNGSFLFL